MENSPMPKPVDAKIPRSKVGAFTPNSVPAPASPAAESEHARAQHLADLKNQNYAGPGHKAEDFVNDATEQVVEKSNAGGNSK